MYVEMTNFLSRQRRQKLIELARPRHYIGAKKVIKCDRKMGNKCVYAFARNMRGSFTALQLLQKKIFTGLSFKTRAFCTIRKFNTFFSHYRINLYYI